MVSKIFVLFFCSIAQALISTVLSLLLALPMAHFFYKFHFFGKKFFLSLAAMLCIMPTKLVALCTQLFYGVYSTGFVGIILAHLLLNIPFVLYIINSTYQKLDANLLWLAAEAGATEWRYYKDIILPLLRSTLISIFLLLFLLHFASFSIPLILGGQFYHNTPEIMIYNLYENKNYIFAFLFWAIRLVIIIPLFLAHNKYAQQKTKISSTPIAVRKKNYNLFKNNILWLLYFIFIITIIVGPLVSLAIRACDIKVLTFFKSIFSFAADPILTISVYKVIINSVLLALISGIGSVFVGFLLSAVECKITSKLGSAILSFITIIAFITGSVGIGILFNYLSSCLFYDRYISSGLIAVLCHIILNYAFAYRIIRAQMVLYHPDLHKSAQMLGASYKKAVWTVSLPFVLPALLRAFCVSFGLSLTEVGASTVLAGQIGLTMPMAIRIYRQSGNQEAVIGLSLILLGLVLLVTYMFSYERK